MTEPTQARLLEAFERIVVSSSYLTLATADEDGAPWASPVWFATADLVEYLWVSSPEALHSRNLAQRPEVAISIFDSHQVPGTGTGAYLRARVEQVADAELDAGLSVYSAASVRQGGSVWTREQVTWPAKHRMYRATAHERFVLDDKDQRVRVPTP